MDVETDGTNLYEYIQFKYVDYKNTITYIVIFMKYLKFLNTEAASNLIRSN